MLYFTSDLHGAYDLFIQLLEKIHFSSQDQMIVCGDVVDKGPDSIKLARLILSQPNMRCILGNHEHQFLKYYWALMRNAENNFDEILKKLQEYFPNDGHLLTWELVDALEALPPYIETEAFICVHAGLPLDANKNILPLQEAEIEQLVNDRLFKEPTILPNSNKCVLFGHTPTSYVANEDKILFYPRTMQPKSIRDYYKIHLDLGTMTSGIIGCLCADTLQTFYMQKK